MSATVPLSAIPANTMAPAPLNSVIPQQDKPMTLEMQRQLLQQKLAEKETPSFTSPTDELMTPVSKKLQTCKQKAYSKTKPLSLSSRFNKAASGVKNKGLVDAPTSTRSSSLANPFGAD